MFLSKSQILYSPDPIYPGGGTCDDNDNPCVGPDCVGGPTGDGDPCAGINPPDECNPAEPCLFGCGGTNVCTGPDCINNVCTGPDCSWGEDGEWNVYWRCEVTGGVSSQAEVIVMKLGSYTTNEDKFEGQKFHYGKSSANYGNSIEIGDAFASGEEAPCYTYLGKKYGDSPGAAVTNGIINNEVLWVDNGYNYYIGPLSCENCIDDPEPEPDVTGCMDPTACNFSSTATIHDQNLCCYVIGCVDPNALNFNQSACCEDEVSCCFNAGCDDSSAVNYDPETCFNDGSCCYVAGCMDPNAINYDSTACLDDGSCVVPEENGYVYGIWCNHQPGVGDNPDITQNFYKTLRPGILDTTSLSAMQSLVNEEWGCTDLMSQLFIPQNALETKDWSGTYRTMVPGDTIALDTNNDYCKTYIGTIESQSDLVANGELQIGGGQTIPSFEFGGPCPGAATAGNYTIVDETFRQTCGTCCDKISDPTCDAVAGCDEPLAYNYDPNTSNPDNTLCEWRVPRYCLPIPSGSYDINCSGNFGNGNARGGGNGGSLNENVYLYGDENSATNAQPDFSIGTLKDNVGYLLDYMSALPALSTGSLTDLFSNTPSVSFEISGEYEVCFTWVGWDTYVGDGSILFNDNDGYGISTSGPNTGQTAAIEGPYGNSTTVSTNISGASITSNEGMAPCGDCGTYGPNGTADKSGCTDPAALNYDIFAVLDDGTCCYENSNPIYGCTMPTANNYNSDIGVIDDGSCYWKVCNSLEGGYHNYQYLCDTVDAQGLSIPISSDMTLYDQSNPGAITNNNSCCTSCGDYVNQNNDQKLTQPKFMFVNSHPAVIELGLSSGSIVLDFQYPSPSGVVQFPHTDELKLYGGTSNTAYIVPPYNVTPGVDYHQPAVFNSYSATTNSITSNGMLAQVEYDSNGGTSLSNGSGQEPWVGKVFTQLPNDVHGFDTNDSVGLTVTLAGTGCQYLYTATTDALAPVTFATTTTCDVLTQENDIFHNEPGEFCLTDHPSIPNLQFRVNYTSALGPILDSAPIGTVIIIEALTGPNAGSKANYKTANVPNVFTLNLPTIGQSTVADVQVVNTGGSVLLGAALLQNDTEFRYSLCITR